MSIPPLPPEFHLETPFESLTGPLEFHLETPFESPTVPLEFQLETPFESLTIPLEFHLETPFESDLVIKYKGSARNPLNATLETIKSFGNALDALGSQEIVWESRNTSYFSTYIIIDCFVPPGRALQVSEGGRVRQTVLPTVRGEADPDNRSIIEKLKIPS